MAHTIAILPYPLAIHSFLTFLGPLPYVLRPYPGAQVATPLDWREVARGLTPARFHIRDAPERFARLGDLFEGVLTRRQRLETPMQKLEELVRGLSRRD